MSDHRGWQMAEQEHAARLAAVKAGYDAEIERLQRELAECKEALERAEDAASFYARNYVSD